MLLLPSQVRLAQSEAALDESRNSNAAMQDTLAELEASHQDVLHQLTQKDVDLDECLDKVGCSEVCCSPLKL